MAGPEQPRPMTTAQLADHLRRDADAVAVAELYELGQDLGKVIPGVVDDERNACG